MNRIERIIRKNEFLHLYLPESFEWLLLQSGIFKDSQIKNMLSHVEDFVDSKEYFSWEQFFTDYLIQASKNSYLQYSKRKLNENYLQGTIIKQILKSIKGIIFKISDSD